jgi:hypothetical protein
MRRAQDVWRILDVSRYDARTYQSEMSRDVMLRYNRAKNSKPMLALKSLSDFSRVRGLLSESFVQETRFF